MHDEQDAGDHVRRMRAQADFDRTSRYVIAFFTIVTLLTLALASASKQHTSEYNPCEDGTAEECDAYTQDALDAAAEANEPPG
jgi:hypothetical protein